MTDRILVLIKPDGVERRLVGEILRRIEAKGYDVTALKTVVPTPELLDKHYAEHVDRPFYPGLVEYMTRDPTTAAPGSIRGDLARDQGGEAMENLVHGSDGQASAEREIAIWFPELG